MRLEATNPDGVVSKIYESRHFLTQMADYEAALDTEKFLYSLSAFLTAFGTAANRSYGVAEHFHGELAKEALKQQLRNHPDVGFLISRRNIEVHADGAVVHQRYAIEVVQEETHRWNSRTDAAMNRWRSLNKSRYGDGIVIRRAAGWQFEGNPKNLIELCHDALEAMQKLVVPVITAPPTVGKSAGQNANLQASS